VEDAERIARRNAEREDELKRIPLQTVDKSKWPRNIRPISMSESDGLGIDPDGRLHWNGKPVEIIGRRLDFTRKQALVGLVVAFFTIVAGIGAAAQGWAAYHDWACRNSARAFVSCPAAAVPPLPRRDAD
jgi:hypothetical protein